MLLGFRKIDFGQALLSLGLMFALLSITATGCKGPSEPNGASSLAKNGESGESNESNESNEPLVEDPKDPISETTNSNSATSTPDSMESETKELRLFLEEYQFERDTETKNRFTDAELHKNFTLMMLSSEPDIRARDLVKFVRNVLSDEQKEQALELAMSQDHKFQKLIKRRAELLENARDGQNIEPALRQIYEETVAVSRKIRADVYNEIVTAEQRAELAAQKEAK